MAQYELKDDTTGMSVVVESERDLTEQDVTASLSEARKLAAKSIETGRYKIDEDTNEQLDKTSANAKLRKYAGYAMGINPDEVDIDSGMGLLGRLQLDLLPDEGSRIEFLQKKYGDDNVSALNIGGKAKMFYRDPKTKKMTMVDEMGASLADFTADIAGEAITTAGAVGGAVAGTILAPGVGTVAGATGGAALGGFLTGVTQDVVAEVATGQDIELGQKMKQRGIEMAIGIPIDLATLGAGKVFSRALAGRGANALVKELDSAVATIEKSDVFQKANMDMTIPAALRTGMGSRQASEIAAARPNSKLAKELQSVRDRVQTIKQMVTGEQLAGQRLADFNSIAEGITQSYRNIVDDIAKIDKQGAQQIQDALSNKVQKMMAPKVSEEGIGERIRELLAPGVRNIEETNKQNWSNLRAVGAGVTVPIKSIIRAIDDATAQFDRLELPQAKAIVRDLKKIMKGKKGEGTGVVGLDGEEILGAGIAGRKSINFNEFKEITDLINDAVSRNKEAGFSTRERVATRILEGLQGGDGKPGLRGIIAGTNPQLGEALNTALDFYKNNLLATRRSAVGRTLREQLADPAITPSQVAKLAVQDPAYIRQALNIAKQGDPQDAAFLQQELRDLYLNRVGLTQGFDAKTGVKFNEDIVRELWGNRQVKDLQNLNKRISQAQGVKFADVRQDEVYRLFSAFSGDEKGRIMSDIVKRMKQESKYNSMLNNQLLKKLQPKKGAGGEWLEPDYTGFDLAKFSDGFVNASPSQVKRTMELLKKQGDESGLQAFRQSYIGNLFNKFSGGAQMDRFGNPMWNPTAMQQALKPGSQMRQNLESVLGKQGADEILAMNKILLEAAETRGAQVQEIFQPRYSLTSGGLQFYGVGNLIGGLRGRALAWAYSTKTGSRLMRFLANPATDAETEVMLRKLLPALMTSASGLKAAAIQGEFDPDFTEQISPLYDNIAAQGAE